MTRVELANALNALSGQHTYLIRKPKTMAEVREVGKGDDIVVCTSEPTRSLNEEDLTTFYEYELWLQKQQAATQKMHADKIRAAILREQVLKIMSEDDFNLLIEQYTLYAPPSQACIGRGPNGAIYG